MSKWSDLSGSTAMPNIDERVLVLCKVDFLSNAFYAPVLMRYKGIQRKIPRFTSSLSYDYNKPEAEGIYPEFWCRVNNTSFKRTSKDKAIKLFEIGKSYIIKYHTSSSIAMRIGEKMGIAWIDSVTKRIRIYNEFGDVADIVEYQPVPSYNKVV